ncbi:HD-GYP domain-containing protein [Deinococcus sonorensis]|uniref:HD-GYP domain-containing protein n=2 Tax=Deinococcus sonorensis TaxID=309891 RepID=A0AAU7UCY0_9DEIO
MSQSNDPVVPATLTTQQRDLDRTPLGQDPLLALQPSALFLLDDTGVVRRVGGAWQQVTGIAPADAVGQPLSSWLRLPNTLFPEGLFTVSGHCDEAILTGVSGARRVRVVWQRQGRQIAGHLEQHTLSARAAYEASVREQQAQEALDEALSCLGASLDAVHGAHVQRMSRYAIRLAEAAGLSAEEVRWVRWGASLHDVGKSRVPAEILWKQGPLTPTEFEVLLHHPSWGAQLVEELTFLPLPVREAILHHHERYDGQGYPAGLSADTIPLTARVVAIADVFDALTSVRSYKPAWSYQQAAEHLVQGAGRQFDPWLVRVFVLDVLHFESLRDQLDQPAG